MEAEKHFAKITVPDEKIFDYIDKAAVTSVDYLMIQRYYFRTYYFPRDKHK